MSSVSGSSEDLRVLTQSDWVKLDEMYRNNANFQHLPQMRQQAANDVEQYEAKISALHNELISLENRCREIERYRDRCEQLSAPIRQLPREILVMIFLHYADSMILTMERRYGRSYLVVPGSTLAHVCTYWRSLSFSIHELWSYFAIFVGEQARTQDTRNIVPLLESAVERSQSHPLTFLYDDAFKDFRQGQLFFEVLLPQKHRWKHTRFSLVSEKGWDGFLTRVAIDRDSELPLLETLEMAANLTEADPESLVIPNAPKLTNVILKKMGNPVEFQCHQVQSLSLVNTPLENWDSIQAFSHLTSLTWSPHPKNEVSMGMTTLQITTLVIEGLGNVAKPDNFLEHLTLPRLTSLTFQGDSGTFPEMQFQSFLERSQCSMTELYFDGYGPRDPLSFSSILRALPSLTTLALKEVKYGGNFYITDHHLQRLHLLLPTSSISGFSLARLKSLTIKSVYETRFTDQELVDMVKSRWCPEAPSDSSFSCIERIDISSTHRKFSATALRPLRRLQSAGLRITILDRDGFAIV